MNEVPLEKAPVENACDLERELQAMWALWEPLGLVGPGTRWWVKVLVWPPLGVGMLAFMCLWMVLRVLVAQVFLGLASLVRTLMIAIITLCSFLIASYVMLNVSRHLWEWLART